MGNFLGCFGKSKDQGRHTLAQGGSTTESRFVITYGTGKQDYSSKIVNSEEESPVVKQENQSSSNNTQKRVTFDSNVRTYEHIPVDDTPEIQPDLSETDSKEIKTIPDIRDFLIKHDQSLSLPPSGSSTPTTSSSASYYPPNHRYHNYRETDDEDDTLNEEFFDLEDNNDDDNEVRNLYEDDDQYDDHTLTSQDSITPASCSSMESSATRSSTAYTEQQGNLPDSDSLDGEKPILDDNSGSRYYHNNNNPVLNAVENLTHLRAAANTKVLSSSQSKQQKENFISLEEKLLETKLSLASKQDEEHTQELVTDASLSSWLVLSQKGLSSNKKGAASKELETVLSETSASSCGFNAVATDRADVPILGALTLEDLNELSPYSSPLIVETNQSRNSKMSDSSVATRWCEESPVVGSASSFKGIPNTTSKYREDKRVNWHSTPFETRLERALNMGADKAHSAHRH